MGCRCGKTRKTMKRKGRTTSSKTSSYDYPELPDILGPAPVRPTPMGRKVHPEKGREEVYEFDPKAIKVELKNHSSILTNDQI